MRLNYIKITNYKYKRLNGIWILFLNILYYNRILLYSRNRCNYIFLSHYLTNRFYVEVS